MKHIIPLLILVSCSSEPKCWVDKTPKAKCGGSETIMMGGVSTINEYQLQQDGFKYDAITTNQPRKRVSKYVYRHFLININVDSNDDTGKDRITILFGEEPIAQYLFGEEEKYELEFYEQDDWEQISVVVDNQSTPNHSAGAFKATIKIKQL